MAETLTNTNGSIVLKQSTIFNRPFYFGTVSQTVTVNLSKNSGAWAAANGAVTEIGGAGNGKGWYNVALTSTDTNTAGVLAYDATAASGGPVDFCDIVQTNIFTDLAIDGTGRAFITSNNRQNTAQSIFFPMTVNGSPTPGLTVQGFRNFGSGFSVVSGAITDLGNGAYMFAAQAADTNAASALYRFTSATAGTDDRDLFFYFQP